MTIEQIVRLLSDVAKVVDVVGLGIAEHLPWDALAMKNMLAQQPLLGQRSVKEGLHKFARDVLGELTR